MPTRTCIIGAGIDSTVIKLIADAPTFRKSGSIRTFQTSHITITDLTQDGNRASQSASSARNYGRYGFFSELSNYVYLARFRVRNNVFYGFDPHGSKLFWSYLLVMEKCEAEGNGLDGFTIDQTARATISGGFARRNDRHGFNVVTGTQLALFDKCTAVDNGERSSVGFGFVAQNNHLKGTGRVMFRRCRACNNNKGAVRLTDVHDVVVEDSVFDGKGKQVCYELDRTRKVALRRNECHGFAKSRKFKIIPDATGTRADEGGEKASAPPSAAVGVIVGMAQWLEREKGKLLGKN